MAKLPDWDEALQEMLAYHHKYLDEARKLLDEHGENCLDMLTNDHKYCLATAYGVPTEPYIFTDKNGMNHQSYRLAYPVNIYISNGKFAIAKSEELN